MGKRGPPPKPTPVLEMRGSWRAKARKATEPHIEVAEPKCPGWLSQKARLMWRELSAVLARMRVLTEADRWALARYCALWQRWRAAEEEIARGGQTRPKVRIDEATGDPVEYGEEISPWVRIARELSGELARAEREFGLTPSARTSVKTIAEAGDGESGNKKAILKLG